MSHLWIATKWLQSKMNLVTLFTKCYRIQKQKQWNARNDFETI